MQKLLGAGVPGVASGSKFTTNPKVKAPQRSGSLASSREVASLEGTPQDDRQSAEQAVAAIKEAVGVLAAEDSHRSSGQQASTCDYIATTCTDRTHGTGVMLQHGHVSRGLPYMCWPGDCPDSRQDISAKLWLTWSETAECQWRQATLEAQHLSDRVVAALLRQRSGGGVQRRRAAACGSRGAMWPS